MHLNYAMSAALSITLLTGCMHKGNNPADPYEPLNRKFHAFNMKIDTILLKPMATVYKTLLPAPIRGGINNVYNNINQVPTVANDLLQADWNNAIKDSWRFVINSSLGMAGVFDVATNCQLPPHINDLGLTFAKWGDKQSPYVVIPLLGPSTFRDGMALMFDYALFTPYAYINSYTIIYSILGVRYVDLRSQLLETDRLIDESLDKYAFIRDAYLQHRNYVITGEKPDNGELYVDDETNDSVLSSTPETELPKTNSPKAQNATHRAPST